MNKEQKLAPQKYCKIMIWLKIEKKSNCNYHEKGLFKFKVFDEEHTELEVSYQTSEPSDLMQL